MTAAVVGEEMASAGYEADYQTNSNCLFNVISGKVECAVTLTYGALYLAEKNKEIH